MAEIENLIQAHEQISDPLRYFDVPTKAALAQQIKIRLDELSSQQI